MTKQSALKKLETIIGKLSHLQYHIEGSTDLQDATRAVAHVRDNLRSNVNTMRQIKFHKQ